MYLNLTCTAKQKQIRRSACIHLAFLPLSQPTQNTYTRALKILLTQMDSSDTFILLFCLLVRSKSFHDELDVVEGILCFFKQKKNNTVDNCQVLHSSHHEKCYKCTHHWATLSHNAQEKICWKNGPALFICLYAGVCMNHFVHHFENITQVSAHARVAVAVETP